MLRIVLVASFVIGSAVMWLLHGAAKIGVGYAAKQVCSGVFISHLPVEFTLDKDVLPRLATVLGMDRFVDVEIGDSFVTATLLTASATASYRDRYGCTLHSNESALPADTARQRAEQSSDVSPVRSTNSAIETAIDALFEEPDEGGRNTLAVLIMHRGEIVAERYAAPVGPSTRLQGWSMNKSLMASFVGVQVGRGVMSLSSGVKDQLAALDSPESAVSQLDDELTLRHLLSMASGLDFDERYFPGDDVTEMLYGHGPMWQVPLMNGHRIDPGTEFVYSSGDTNVVSYLWQSSLAGEP
jgi:CubicO group peptidase (beta-lactamase class C family)